MTWSITYRTMTRAAGPMSTPNATTYEEREAKTARPSRASMFHGKSCEEAVAGGHLLACRRSPTGQ